MPTTIRLWLKMRRFRGFVRPWLPYIVFAEGERLLYMVYLLGFLYYERFVRDFFEDFAAKPLRSQSVFGILLIES